MKSNYTRLKLACYTTNLSMSAVGNISPVLLLTFRSLYGISYSMLGLLVLINFFTQLSIDLLFSFFSHKFDIRKTVRLTPVICAIGLGVYALVPVLFPDCAYLGLVIGTVIFAASGGLSEVLLSPVFAKIPSKDPDKEMSKLHSVYAWGVVFVVLISTAFISLFQKENWYILALIFLTIPLTSSILFAVAEIPDIETPEKLSGTATLLKNRGLWLSVLAIFLGGAAECTMAQWASSYIEGALGIPKAWGDVFGVAVFSVMLGLGRTLYSKWGKNIEKVLLGSAIGAFLCYSVAALSPSPVLSLIACALTGLFVAMMWPGNLVVASERFPSGVFIYALMASGGDLGASVGPQLVGLVTDIAIGIGGSSNLAANLGIGVEQLGMRIGMLVGMLFPLLAIFVYIKLLKTKKQ